MSKGKDQYLDSRSDHDAQSRLAAEAPLLLHSLSEFDWLIGPLLAAVGPDCVVEIGGETGDSAASYLGAGAGRVVCVDPDPQPMLVEMAREEPRLRLVVDRSPGCIPTLPAATFWVLDGDHNYATVRAELEAILDRRAPGEGNLIMLHDVLWPWARRDLYYDPAALEDDEVHPHRWDAGPAVGHPGLREDGFVGAGRYAAAAAAGGERNGVRTALEDVLASRPQLECAIVPAVFGVAVVYDPAAAWAGEVAEILRPWDRSPFLARLESNRIALYSKVLELQHTLDQRSG